MAGNLPDAPSVVRVFFESEHGRFRRMRTWTQLAVVAVVAALGTGWQVYGPEAGLPTPMQLLGLGKAEGQPGRPGGGGPQSIPVVTVPVRVGTVTERVDSVGSVRAFEAVTVTSRVSGIVTRINFTEGEKVEAGRVLVELDAAQARAELDQALAARADTSTQLQRARALRTAQAVTEQRIDTLEALLRGAEGRIRQAEAKIAELKIIAPFAGRVGLRKVSLGALVQPGGEVTTLDDLSRAKIEFAVPELYVERVQTGMQVDATSEAFGARRFTGEVTVINTRVDVATRTVRVVSEFANPEEALRPGLFMTVGLTLSTRSDALLVPEEAIDPIADRAYLYVVREGRARRVEVRLGARVPGEVQVTGAVQPGEPVVTRGIQRLRDGVAVNSGGPPQQRPTS